VISAIPASIDRWVQSLSEKLNMGVSRATTWHTINEDAGGSNTAGVRNPTARSRSMFRAGMGQEYSDLDG
jgi:hypothetical protein